MIKNTASQVVAFQMIAIASGAPVTTGTPVVYVTGDGGTQGTGAGAKVHEGNGCWSYVVSAADSNFDHVAFTMVLADAVSQTVNVYPAVLADYKATGFATPTNITAGTIATVTNQVTADVTAISGDTTAADNLELQYDTTGLSGDTFPATQAQLDNLSSSSAAISAVSASFTILASKGTETSGTYTDTSELNTTYHIITSDGNSDIDVYYEFSVGGNGIPVSATWTGYAQAKNDIIGVYGYNYGTTTYEQIGTIDKPEDGIKIKNNEFNFTVNHVGTGADLGKVRLAFKSIDCTLIATDQVLCSYAVVAQSVGYANGMIWVDTGGTAGTELYINGTADNPCPWADALTIDGTLNLNRFHVANDNTITLGADFNDQTITGEHWYLALGGQSINDSHIVGAEVTGVGSAADHSVFEHCEIGEATIPPGRLTNCGIGQASGKFTAASNGDYTFVRCYSLVPGAGSPEFDFDTNITGTTGVNNRAWSGGSNYSGVDANVTLSHEVLAGGEQTIDADTGGNMELRGTFRSATLTVGGTNQVIQVVGVTGPIAISGSATTGVVNLYGVSSAVTDTSTGTTVTNATVNSTDMQSILTDTADMQPKVNAIAIDVAGLDGDAMRGTDGANTTVPDAAGTAATLHGITDGKVDVIDGIVDTILVDTNELQLNQGNWLTSTLAAADVWNEASGLTLDFGTLLEQLYQWHVNKESIVDATGAVVLRNVGDSADLASWGITDNDTITVRTEVIWS